MAPWSREQGWCGWSATRAVMAAALLLAFAPSLAAAGPVSRVPGAEGLELEITYYSRGRIAATVINTTDYEIDFDPEGIFFVPVRRPRQQRMVVAGSFSYRRRGERKRSRTRRLRLSPRESVRVTLPVYCLDREKSYPTSRTPFRLASRRIPGRVSEQFGGGLRGTQRRVWRAVRGTGLNAPAWRKTMPTTWRKKNSPKLPTFHPAP